MYRLLATNDLVNVLQSSGMYKAAEPIIADARLRPGTDTDAKLALNALYLKNLYHLGNYPELEKALGSVPLSREQNGVKLLYQGQIAAASENRNQATLLLSKAADTDPFNEDIAQAVYNYFNREQALSGIAYNTLLNMVVLNPDNVPIRKLYTLQCVRQGFYMFAGQSLERLDYKLNNIQFNAFKKQCDSLSTATGGAF